MHNPALCPGCWCEPTGTNPDGSPQCSYCDPKREAEERDFASLRASLELIPLSTVDLFPPIRLAA